MRMRAPPVAARQVGGLCPSGILRRLMLVLEEGLLRAVAVDVKLTILTVQGSCCAAMGAPLSTTPTAAAWTGCRQVSAALLASPSAS
jgi:hypothetical protein